MFISIYCVLVVEQFTFFNFKDNKTRIKMKMKLRFIVKQRTTVSHTQLERTIDTVFLPIIKQSKLIKCRLP